MALRTAIIRDDEPVRLPNGWGWWHVECMAKAIRAEEDQPDLALFDALCLQDGRYTLTRGHTFTDPDDGEVLVLKTGDVLKAWRDR